MFRRFYRPSACTALIVTCIAAISPAWSANDTPAEEQHSMVTTTGDYATQNNITPTQDADTAPVQPDTMNAATSPSGQPAQQLPVPKRLSAQERWNKMTREDRAALIAEWENLDEVTRPVFLVYRDNVIEKNLRPASPLENGAAQTTSQAVQP